MNNNIHSKNFKKVVDRISREISPSELEDNSEIYIKRNMGGYFNGD